MTLAIQALLSLLEELIPLITSTANASLISSIITTLSGFLPFIVQEISALYQPVKNIIEALSATPATTAAQLAQLQILDQQVDSAFEAIAAQTDADGKTS